MSGPKLTFKQQMQGFPYTQIFIVSLVRFAEPIAFTSLFPYVFYMVRDFGIPEADVSTYSGYLSSTFAMCQVVSSFSWGHFSDRFGRKPALFVGILGTLVTMLAMGLSTTFWQALLARSAMGLLNGNVSVIRTLLGEIATERRHQALAFSTMPLTWQLGCVIGPWIGGSLAFPRITTTKYPAWAAPYADTLQKYPYIVPNLVVSVLLFIAFCNAVLFLEETHFKHKYRRDYGVDLGDAIRRKLGFKPPVRPWHTAERQPLLEEETVSVFEDSFVDDASITTNEVADFTFLTRRQSVSLIRQFSAREETDALQPPSIWHLMLFTPVFYPIAVNFIMSLHLNVHDLFLPIFLSYDLELKGDTDVVRSERQLASVFPFKILGGIGYTPEQTGELLSRTGMFGVIVVLFIFPYVDRNYSTLSIFRNFTKFYPILYLVIPYVVFLQTGPEWWTGVYMYIITASKTLIGAIAFPQIMLLIHQSSPLEHRAVINGATLSVASLARFLGPIIWGYIMMWAEEYEVAWVSWWTLAAVAGCGVILGNFITLDEEENANNEDGLSGVRKQLSLSSLRQGSGVVQDEIRAPKQRTLTGVHAQTSSTAQT